MMRNLLRHTFHRFSAEGLTPHTNLIKGVLERNVIGDIVELGVWKGGTAANWAYNAQQTTTKRTWVYDTFAGHPPGLNNDLNPAKITIARKKFVQASEMAGSIVGTEDDVRKAFKAVGLTDVYVAKHIVWRKGFFNQTMLLPIPDAIALLHIDCDWYECTLDALRRFYSKIPCGGVVVFDDFNLYGGQRQAFYDFLHDEALINPAIKTFGPGQAYFIKGDQY